MQSWKHWRLESEKDGVSNIAFLYFDKSHADGAESTNTFSSEALGELAEICAHLKANPVKSLAILSAKENGFAAGADIDEFTRFMTMLTTLRVMLNSCMSAPAGPPQGC